MSNALANLKLTAAKRPAQLPPVAQRRNKLVKRLNEQIELAKAQQDGRTYAPTRLRSVKNAETGEKTTVESAKRIKPWWFVAENGKVCVSLQYGAKRIELAKGKSAAEVGNAAELIAALETLKAAVTGGELDAQIEAVAGAVKAGFKK
jgi:Family of unknown function (DUF6641)